MEKRKVILDVDTGSDDAIALICALANPDFEVLGITTVNGNRAVPITTENTLRISELMGGKVPVYRGCAPTSPRTSRPTRPMPASTAPISSSARPPPSARRRPRRWSG